MKLSYDFVVVGGGVAGICAAVAAARKGIRTALIQDRPVLGGNSSSEIRVPPSGSVEKNAWSMETGIIEEILLEDRARNHEYTFTGYMNSNYDMLLYSTAKNEKYLDLFLNTVVRDVEVSYYDCADEGKKRIASVSATELGSGRDMVFSALQFVDCTGDGEVGFMAGADYRYGREGRSEYNESLAPQQSDDEVMGSTISFLARNIGCRVEFKPPVWAKKFRSAADIGLMRDIGTIMGKNAGDVYCGYWWMEIGDPYHQVHDTGKIREELLANIMGVWDYIKNCSDQKENTENYALEWIGKIPGKRESRRLLGDVVVTEENCHRDAQWYDRISNSGWFLDAHIKGGLLNKQAPPEPSFVDNNYKNYTLVAPFTVPLRACYSKNIANLWMAGRDISVSHVALSSVRVQCTLANIGQAVGIAAAYAITHGITPREAAQVPNVRNIQQDIIKDDVCILGVKNNDRKDLALNAKIRASSEQALDLGRVDAAACEKLDIPRAQVFPVTRKSVETIEVFLKNESDEEHEIKAELHELTTIWDQDEGRFVVKTSFKVPPRFCGWLPVHMNAATTSGKPHRISLEGPEEVCWVHSIHQPVGTTAQYLYTCKGGCEAKNSSLPFMQPAEVDIPPFKYWNNFGWRRSFSFAVKITPSPLPFGGSNVNNGLAWPCDMPNIWISDERETLPQYVELDMGEVQEFNTLMVSFDTGLNLLHTYMPGSWRAPACAREWELYAKLDSGWSLIYREGNNYQRRRVVRIEAIKASAVKLMILKTNAGEDDKTDEKNCARVYEIRIYKE